jgi:uncharacterized protein with PIN domain
MSTARVLVAEPLRFLLPVRDRHGELTVPVDAASTIGHVVESLGVPRTEVGELLVHGRPAAFTDRASAGDVIDVAPVRRPQAGNGRFLLDVHLGTLARRMRLLGLDTSYSNDADDPELVDQAVAEDRTLLTQDRGLLRRRALVSGAYVHGSDPDDQLLDVLSRFDPPWQPWTRCLACNGLLERVDKAEVADELEPGTRRSYEWFYRCQSCARTYWRGAHAGRLDDIIAVAAKATGRQPPVSD